jgi:hypothetical protein
MMLLVLEIAGGIFVGGVLLRHWEWVLGVVWMLVLLTGALLAFSVAYYLLATHAY